MMKLFDRKKKILGNKGFSLVELIIVIAIMAVLIAVLAPQYIKYVEKSRVSADNTFADSLKNAVSVLLSDDDYSATVDGDFTVTWSTGAVAVNGGATLDAAGVADVEEALVNTLGADYETQAIKSNTYKTQTYTITVSFSTGAGLIASAGWPVTP